MIWGQLLWWHTRLGHDPKMDVSHAQHSALHPKHSRSGPLVVGANAYQGRLPTNGPAEEFAHPLDYGLLGLWWELQDFKKMNIIEIMQTLHHDQRRGQKIATYRCSNFMTISKACPRFQVPLQGNWFHVRKIKQIHLAIGVQDPTSGTEAKETACRLKGQSPETFQRDC